MTQSSILPTVHNNTERLGDATTVCSECSYHKCQNLVSAPRDRKLSRLRLTREIAARSNLMRPLPAKTASFQPFENQDHSASTAMFALPFIPGPPTTVAVMLWLPGVFKTKALENVWDPASLAVK